MSIGYIQAPPAPFPGLPLRSTASLRFGGITLRGVMLAAHRTLLALGVCAITIVLMMICKPPLADHIKTMSPFSNAANGARLSDSISAPQIIAALPATRTADAPSAQPAATLDDKLSEIDTTRQQELLTGWLSRRYHVAGDALGTLVSASYVAAGKTKLDPLLILAVISIESRFNPFAEGGQGTQGLMLVRIDEQSGSNGRKGRARAALDPIANIRLGSQRLKDDIALAGSVESGLKQYVSGGTLGNNAPCVARILAEYRQLKQLATRDHAAGNLPAVRADDLARYHRPKIAG